MRDDLNADKQVGVMSVVRNEIIQMKIIEFYLPPLSCNYPESTLRSLTARNPLFHKPYFYLGTHVQKKHA